MGDSTVDLHIDTSVKRYYILKTNGIANIRAINIALAGAPEKIRDVTFWMAGYMSPRKLRSSTVLRKQFLYYDYAFVAIHDPIAFEDFLSERKIPAYFLHNPGTAMPCALTEEEIQRIKQLESFKQLESDTINHNHGVKLGSLIEVCNGPFIGCKGTVIEIRSTYSILEMNVFGRPTRVNVGAEFLNNVLQTYETVDTFPADSE